MNLNNEDKRRLGCIRELILRKYSLPSDLEVFAKDLGMTVDENGYVVCEGESRLIVAHYRP